jgi:hypothetical protein
MMTYTALTLAVPLMAVASLPIPDYVHADVHS